MMHTFTQPQQTAPQAPVAPAAPVVPPGAPVAITTVGPDGQPRTFTIPTTRAEVRELLMQREELSDQLINVSSRRRELASEINETGNATIRSGLEDRLRVLDARILQLETDLATTGRQLATAPAEMLNTSISQPAGDGAHFEEGLMIGGGAVFFAAAVLFLLLRRKWRKRMGRPGVGGQLEGDTTQRLERLENGMDAIAIEIERVSEGQRFVTKLLSESHSAGASSRKIGEPVAVPSDSSRNR